MGDKPIRSEVLDRYYRRAYTGGAYIYQTRKLACTLCEHSIELTDVPKQTPFRDSNFGKVARLKKAMRDHLRQAHALKIALLEQEKQRQGQSFGTPSA